MAFYRKYTEGLLRRYVRLSMEAGRAPSLLGREMFRGNVTNYSVTGFDDVVIFVHDVESCVKMLDEGKQHLIRRIALQEFTHGGDGEAAAVAVEDGAPAVWACAGRPDGDLSWNGSCWSLRRLDGRRERFCNVHLFLNDCITFCLQVGAFGVR